MKIMPIPDFLLCDSFVLLVPLKSGFRRVAVENVRVERTSRISDYSSARMRDTTQITVYFDCEKSLPSDTEFCAGQLAEFDGERYELTEVRLFSADSAHHVRIKADKISGERSENV